jgi:hypothetical protein
MIYYGNFKWPSADFTNSTRTVQTQLYNNQRKRKVKDWTLVTFGRTPRCPFSTFCGKQGKNWWTKFVCLNVLAFSSLFFCWSRSGEISRDYSGDYDETRLPCFQLIVVVKVHLVFHWRLYLRPWWVPIV